VALSAGTYATIGGTGKAQAEAHRALALQAAAGGIAILVLLSRVAGNLRNLVLLLLGPPLAILGGILAVAVTAWIGGESPSLSLGSWVGLVTVFGITTRNGIMMISHYRERTEEEGIPWSAESAVQGAADRLLPILMTALVTALALLPVALAADRPGGEIDGPMAIVILGGVIVSTLTNLLLLPTLCLRFGRFGPAPTPAEPPSETSPFLEEVAPPY
jgi:Cu/Ag efflux pump CusA